MGFGIQTGLSASPLEIFVLLRPQLIDLWFPEVCVLGRVVAQLRPLVHRLRKVRGEVVLHEVEAAGLGTVASAATARDGAKGV